MKSNFFFQLVCVLSFCFAISCQKDFKTPIGLEKKIGAKVSNVNNCKTSVQSFELDAVVNIYPIDDRFDYTSKSNFTKYTPDANGNYDMSLSDGNYYFEAINKQGIEIINGTFELPEHLSTNGELILSRVDKGGVVEEQLSNGTQGERIVNAEITHIHEITGKSFVTYSDASGFYCIDLNPGRYQLIAKHKDYITYDTESGFNVFVLGNANRTANVFLTKK